MESTKPTLNEAENGNKSKPLLSSRLFKFRAFNQYSKRMFLWNELENNWIFEDVSRTNNGSSSTILMQFTGLKDKKGTEIYEGDILKFVTNGFDAETFITTIIFDKCSFKLQNNRALFYFGQSDFTKVDDAIVIGNIFENPELL
jgi:uncharacterized phage protein (TIGR01671 family)